MIESPNYPDNYDDDLDCQWIITVAESNFIELELLFFDLEQCCGCDNLEVR